MLFHQQNDDMMFGCIYHILNLYNHCLLHLCTFYTTPLSPAQKKKVQKRMASVKTCVAVLTDTKKCNYFIFIFQIHKIRYFVQCIVHIGTTHMHVYASIPLSTVFYTPIFKLFTFWLQCCCCHGLESVNMDDWLPFVNL